MEVCSSLRISLPYSVPDSGAKIDDILSGKAQKSSTPVPPSQAAPSAPTETKSTHPFFLGKLAAKAQKHSDLKSETASTAPASEDEASTSPKAPKAWKDIIFARRSNSRAKLQQV